MWSDVPLFDVGDGPVKATGRGDLLRVRIGICEWIDGSFHVSLDVHDHHPLRKRDLLLHKEATGGPSYDYVAGTVHQYLNVAREFLPPF